MMTNNSEKLKKLLKKKEETERLLGEIKTEIATTESKISGEKFLNQYIIVNEPHETCIGFVKRVSREPTGMHEFFCTPALIHTHPLIGRQSFSVRTEGLIIIPALVVKNDLKIINRDQFNQEVDRFMSNMSDCVNNQMMENGNSNN